MDVLYVCRFSRIFEFDCPQQNYINHLLRNLLSSKCFLVYHLTGCQIKSGKESIEPKNIYIRICRLFSYSNFINRLYRLISFVFTHVIAIERKIKKINSSLIQFNLLSTYNRKTFYRIQINEE